MQIHLDWGAQGIAFNPRPDVYVIIDVLSFSTCVDIALSCGAQVWPYLYKDDRATDFAHEQEALLAGPRAHDRPSLSPQSLKQLPPNARLVLPSPNGATLSTLTGNIPTVTACLRNAAAVARWIQRQGWRDVLVVAAGERWPDGRLRPALEDLIGSGAVIEGLSHFGLVCSSEARLARENFCSVRDDLLSTLQACPSGQELIERGFAQDVILAAELNLSGQVPLLQSGAYLCGDPH